MRIAIADEEDVEGLQAESLIVLTPSVIGWGHVKHDAFLVDFADLASFLTWAAQFYAVQIVDARLETDGASVSLVTSLTEPDYPD